MFKTIIHFWWFLDHFVHFEGQWRHKKGLTLYNFEIQTLPSVLLPPKNIPIRNLRRNPSFYQVLWCFCWFWGILGVNDVTNGAILRKISTSGGRKGIHIRKHPLQIDHCRSFDVLYNFIRSAVHVLELGAIWRNLAQNCAKMALPVLWEKNVLRLPPQSRWFRFFWGIIHVHMASGADYRGSAQFGATWRRFAPKNPLSTNGNLGEFFLCIRIYFVLHFHQKSSCYSKCPGLACIMSIFTGLVGKLSISNKTHQNTSLPWEL